MKVCDIDSQPIVGQWTLCGNIDLGQCLAQVTACCLTAPSHYMNQCLTWNWWYPPQCNFIEDILVKIFNQNCYLKIFMHLPEDNVLQALYGCLFQEAWPWHYSDIIMSTVASQITSLTIVYSTLYSDANQRKHQSSVSLAFVTGIHLWMVNSSHKGPVTQKMFPFDNIIMDFTICDISRKMGTGNDIISWKIFLKIYMF